MAVVVVAVAAVVVVVAEAEMNADRFGIGWRPRLAAGILSNLERLDIVEVIADDYFRADRQQRRALRTLAAQTRVTLHGVSLGMASAVPVETRRLDDMARLCDEVRPAFWSEHLAFVRGGGVEIGHLAAPPRCEATIGGALANLARAKQIVGIAPQVENVATLIDPPGSDRDEAAWISAIVRNSDSSLLLDLHNLHANALNFGFNASEFLTRIPTEKVATIHLAGGKWIGRNGAQRLLDDHLHDVPDPVYELLAEVAARAPQPLTVILERDGNFPSIEALLVQLDRAREAVARGRAHLIMNEIAA
ncbi:MAG: DUF692 domain-containing protein [Acidobacteria bacterium]|nr:DUF692 domain-containing protein [Acidobacteriota bacterium]